jgi:hypothetical protein
MDVECTGLKSVDCAAAAMMRQLAMAMLDQVRGMADAVRLAFGGIC